MPLASEIDVQVSASAVPKPGGWGARVRLRVQNPGGAEQRLPSPPIGLSGILSSVLADGSVKDHGGFDGAQIAPLRWLVVPARSEVTVNRDYPENWGIPPGEVLSLTVLVGRPRGHPAHSWRRALAEVQLIVPNSSAAPRVEVTAHPPE